MTNSNNQPSVVRNVEQSKRRYDKFNSNRKDLDSSSDNEDVTEHEQALSLADSDNISNGRSSNFDNLHEPTSDVNDSRIHETDWDGFVRKMAEALDIDCEGTSKSEEHKSYISGRLLTDQRSKSRRCQLPLKGSILDSLHDVDDEVSKRKIRAYRSADDSRYKVSTDHFRQYCYTPHLDENIAEGLSSQSSNKSPFTNASRGKGVKLQNKQARSHNSDFIKIDTEARLLLRECSYGSLMVSYLDGLVDDNAKTLALQALLDLFRYIADLTSRILVNSVLARRAIYLNEFPFRNYATEDRLLDQSCLGPELFGGKFFELLHSSAENTRDAKETQHLLASSAKSNFSGNVPKTSSSTRSFDRKRVAPQDHPNKSAHSNAIYKKMESPESFRHSSQDYGNSYTSNAIERPKRQEFSNYRGRKVGFRRR
ncbi:hypothetical protein SNE40_009581 [Patella caerulea]|uniref:Uncharacterized protein n=1 Tax=Patella caerulea TaxID=87958 RepID=A0AAN8PQF1_PATCE